MEIKDFLDMKKLQELQDQFSAATGMAVVAVDSKGDCITEESNYTEFYKKVILGSEEGKRILAKNEIEKMPALIESTGVKGFAFDIEVEGEKIGAMYGGQVLTREPDEEKARKRAEEIGVDPEVYVKHLKKLPIMEAKKIDASAKLLELMISQLVGLAYKDRKDSSKVEDLSKEITYATEVIETINNNTHSLKSIANKQKMLSLNASIEAARSGEAGVGFAVVAKSMGDLSSQSATIYGDIEKSVAEVTEAIQKLDHLFHD